MEFAKRVDRFVITCEVEPGHEAYDDPEWRLTPPGGRLRTCTGSYRFTPTSRSLTPVKGSREVTPGKILPPRTAIRDQAAPGELIGRLVRLGGPALTVTGDLAETFQPPTAPYSLG
ncbi:MAG: hypothetical protein LC808_02905, partial [Actinobacteria bacterium]|nr:hypothetical protein [Actinomycetota bacterium]